MLGKLIKYEFKATVRIFAPLFAALLIVSLISKLMIGLRLETPTAISMILSAMLIAAAFVVTLILTIQRFYKNFLTDEGYLMFTLPVSTGSLIWSKLIVAAVWNIVCTVVVLAAISIMAMSAGEFREFFLSFSQLGLPAYDKVMLIAEFCTIVLASLLCSILSIYACIALSMLFNKHRVAISFAIYIGMITIIQILAAIVISIALNSDIVIGSDLRAFIENHSMLAVHSSAAIALLIIAAFCAAFFAITRSMLKNKLNLQ